jgi:DNA-binding NtrC family response regulator
MGISIVFVDDDANLLQGIARVMKTERRDVAFSLCSSADEVLALLQEKSFHVIVADYRMPGQDGLSLLAVIKERYPAMKRVLLTGQSEAEIFHEAKPIVDRYMSKPYDILALVGEIEEMLK